MPIYKCPRCHGDDVYFGTRQEVRSTGGFDPQKYVTEVQKPFCRKCAEPMMNMGPTPEEAKRTNDAIEARVNFLFSKKGYITIFVVLLLAVGLIYGVWSVINGIVQCMDGYNYETKVIDGESIYINQCDAY